MSNQNPSATKKKFRFPHPVVLMFCIVLIVALCSYFVPAGEYARVQVGDRTVVDPNSYTQVESNPIGVMDFLLAFPKGMTAAASITFFIMLASASFNIITETGALKSAIGRASVAFRNREHLMIPAVIAIFSIGGITFGMSEENVVFVPITIALARALGYDAIVGTSLAVLGAASGFCAGVMNPFTVGVAQSLAELPMFSGMAYRVLIWGVMVAVTSIYVMRYSDKIRRNPQAGLMYDVELAERGNGIDLSQVEKVTGRQKLVLAIVAAGFVTLAVGVMKFDWYVNEIAALFLGMGILSGLVYGFTPDEIIKHFQAGIRDIANGAIMVGIARAILVVMEQGMIIDTAIHAMSGLIASLPSSISVLGMYAVQVLTNFFIPSGSGQAAVTMPIMVPLADVLGINRQVAVLCFQFGDGFTNCILPVSGTMMAILAMAKIPYEKWLKFVGPLVGIWIALGGVFIVAANMFGYGPF